jgi:hypothetical protein
MTNSQYSIGSRLKVTPVSRLSEFLWIAESSLLPEGWSCNLVHKASAAILPGEPVTGWILNTYADRRHIEVSDSEFGFLPISDRMRPRYIASLNRVARLLTKENDIVEDDAAFISEVKGMFSRCARRDQWDWCAVYLALREPSRKEAERTANMLGEVSRALRRSDLDLARSWLERVTRGCNLAHTLLQACAAIENQSR